jgi:hypothetical protein
LPPLGTSQTLTEDPTFTGSKTNLSVVSSQLEITDASGATPSGTYLFSTYLDTGSSRTVRATGEVTFERIYKAGTLLWDNIPRTGTLGLIILILGQMRMQHLVMYPLQYM